MMRQTLICLSVKKIPFVLCGSRYAPILNYAEVQGGGVTRKFPRGSLFASTVGVAEEDVTLANAGARKKRKKKAFDDLVHWCAAHQQAATQAFSPVSASSKMVASVCASPSLECNEAALQWLQESSSSLTCGQSLLVCSFVCEVFLCRLDAAAAATGGLREGSEMGTAPLLQKQVKMLTNRIAVLLQRAIESDKLETQPLAILMGCAYGVHRLSCVEGPFLGETEKTLLKIPPALMFAILRQLRGDELKKLFELDEQVAVNVCLTFLLLVDEERRRVFFPGGDTVIVNTVLRRLLRHIAPLLKQLDDTSEETLWGLANNGSSNSLSPLSSASQGEAVNSPSMEECAAIMQNIAFSSVTLRTEMLSYLLCIRRKPTHYTRRELQMLPVLLQTVSNVRLEEARALSKKIIAKVPIPADDPVLVAHLFSFAPSNGSHYLHCLETMATENLSKEDAVYIVSWAGVHLRWETLQRLTTVIMGKEASPTSSSSSASRLVLNDAVECIVRTFSTRLMNSTPGPERDKTQTYLSQLVNRVDWAGSTAPNSAKLALARLTLLTELSTCGFSIDAPEVVMTLGEKALDLESGSSIVSTIRCVTEALSLLPGVEQRRKMVECMISYSGTRSTSSLIRFVAFLAPLSVAHGVTNSELVQLLLKLQTLNPLKLRQSSIGGLPKGDDAFTLFVVNTINYLLASGEWRTSTDRIREAVTLWIHEYLHHVMNISRKQSVKSEPTHAEGTGDKLAPHEGDVEAAVAGGPNSERLEEVFSCLLRAGVKLPDFFGSELTARVRSIENEGTQSGETGCKPRFPPPGHFVFCCKLDIAMESPLSAELLEHLLTTCDCRVLHFVITAFLVNTKAPSREPHALLLSNLQLVCQALKLFLHRIDKLGNELSAAFYPSSISSVVANAMRFLVGFLTKQERSQRIMGSLRNLHSVEEKEAMTSNNEKLLVELTCVEKLLLRVVAYLSTVHMKDVGLLLLDRLTLLSPAAADYLMLHLQNQLGEFTQVELFYLARKYPPAQDLVMKELQKYDIALSVDLNDFVRVARGLPMAVNTMVIEAHLPNLNFQWCTRILSALAVRHESVPMDLLASILGKLEEEAGDATVMDRNFALVLLQKYLHHEDDIAADDKELLYRQRRVEQCCDRLLVLEGIDSLDSLSGFLQHFPGTLLDVIGDAILERVGSAVLPGLVADLDGLLTLCRLLQKHKLLSDTLRLMITDGFFGKLLRAENGDATLSSSPASYPLGNVLALALLLSEGASQRASLCRKESPGTDGASHHHQITHRVFQAVKERYSSLSDRLMIVNVLVEQRDKGGFVQTHALIAEEMCTELIKECEKMTASEFSRLLQCISRLKCWHLVKVDGSHFGNVFQQNCREADAHSRCVAFKALSSDVELFCHYESLTMPLLGEVVNVMSQEDMEMVLSAVLALQLTEALESLLDAIGTRVLSMVDQCRRSTLIRMLQCHATFDLRDDVLVLRLLAALEEQCSREARLDTSQVLTLLQATVDLDVPIPSKLAVTCFGWLEHHIDSMTMAQLGHAARLAVEVEMGYTASVHAVAMRALEHREALRTNTTFREAVELLCDEFSVEIPWHVRPTALRRRYREERLNDYINKRRSALSHGVN